MIETKALKAALQHLLDGRTFEEHVDRGHYVPVNEPADLVLRELQKLGVSLTVHQQMLGDCVCRVYLLPEGKRNAARRAFSSFKKPKAKIKV